jgi:hypothetical protein
MCASLPRPPSPGGGALEQSGGTPPTENGLSSTCTSPLREKPMRKERAYEPPVYACKFTYTYNNAFRPIA